MKNEVSECEARPSLRSLLTKNEFERIEAEWNLPSPQPELRIEITLALVEFLDNRRSGRLRYAEVNKRLKDVEKKANAFFQSIRPLMDWGEPDHASDDVAFLFMHAASLNRANSARKIDIDDIGRACHLAEDIGAAARSALVTFTRSDPRGCPPDRARHDLFGSLIRTYEKFTGQKALVYWKDVEGRYVGALLYPAEIVEFAAARAIGEEPRPAKALGAFLKEIIENKRERQKEKDAVCST